MLLLQVILYLQIVSICHNGLGVEDYGIAFKEGHIAAWDQQLLIAFDQDNDGVSGNIQIPDLLTCPGIFGKKSDFFQFDSVFVLERFCADNQYVIWLKDEIALRNQNTVISLNNGYDDFFWKTEVCNAVSGPFILFTKLDSDKMYIIFLTVFTHPFQPGILFYESGRNNTGGDGNHTDTEKRNKNTEDFSNGGNWINITVTYSQQSGGCPPDSGKSIGKNFWLRPIFQAVHAEAGRKHQDQDNKYRG